jgi:hypothetical protein
MVWIHGGGFLNGSSDIYKSGWLATRGDIVVGGGRRFLEPGGDDVGELFPRDRLPTVCFRDQLEELLRRGPLRGGASGGEERRHTGGQSP